MCYSNFGDYSFQTDFINVYSWRRRAKKKKKTSLAQITQPFSIHEHTLTNTGELIQTPLEETREAKL